MPKIHLLNVKPGDCTIIQHASGRVTMMDICSGNQHRTETARKMALEHAEVRPRGNFRMCEVSTDPVEYLSENGIKSIFRFILSHPDMDHMDGLERLFDTFRVTNFWETGSARPKPDFGGGRFLEADWDKFDQVRSGRQGGTTHLVRRAGARFAYANQNEEGESGGDGLHILAPTDELISDPDFADDVNEGSYVIAYNSLGGKVVLPGDAHDAAWKHIIANEPGSIRNCAFMLAPHHGRHSNRSYDFLDLARPKLTLIGCAPSEHIDYDQWHRRGLDLVTSNQAGNVVLEIGKAGIDAYIENESFAQAKGCDLSIRNEQGYVFLKAMPNT